MNHAALTSPSAARRHRHGKLSSGAQLMYWVAGLSALILVRDLLHVHLPDLVVSGFCALAFLFLDTGSGMGFYLFTSTMTLPDSEVRIFYVLVFLLKLIKNGKQELHGGMLLLSIGCMMLQLVDMAIFSTLGLAGIIYDYIVRMLLLMLPLLWYSTTISARGYRHAMLCYVWGSLLGATIVMIIYAQRYGLLSLMTGSSAYIRLGETGTTAENMITSYNPNQLGTMLALSISIVLAMMSLKQLPKLLAFPIIVYSLVLILLTRSRTALLLCAGIAVLFYWFIIIQRRQFLRGIILFAALLLVLILVITLFPGVVEATLDRFLNQDDITNGRNDILAFYLKEWGSNPWCLIFGYGIGSYRDALPHATISPHNSISDILISWGLVGLFLVFGILWLCYRRSRKFVPRALVLLCYLPAIVALVDSFAGQYLTTGFPHTRTCFLLLAATGFIDAAQKGSSR